jgi:hypothetical protein
MARSDATGQLLRVEPFNGIDPVLPPSLQGIGLTFAIAYQNHCGSNDRPPQCRRVGLTGNLERPAMQVPDVPLSIRR